MKTALRDLLSKVGVKRQLYPYRYWLAGLVALLALGTCLYMGFKTSLCVRNAVKELVFFSPLPAGQDFCIRFIHSVAKSPVEEWFKVQGGKILLDRTVYQDFGAGLPHEASTGQHMAFDDGVVTISGYNMPLPELTVRVGRVAEHILLLEQDEAPQTPLRGKARTVRAVPPDQDERQENARNGSTSALFASPRTTGKAFMAIPLQDMAPAGAALTFSVEACFWKYCAPRP